ncbi:hypothetical protein ACO2Q3_04340 [Caulobacter sp. KR2-114]|uniref:hypothetical protein n=1 Tax=Caulobacter sp. KR2-114 TaxID=3400912 RepID=UPI003BFBABBA
MSPGKTAALPFLAVLVMGAAPVADAPPLSPQGEAADRGGPSPSPDCIARLVGQVQRAGGHVERAQTSDSPRWGRVWRADVALPDAPAGKVNRAVCWAGGLQFARGQDLPPLPTAGGAAHRAAAAPCDYTEIENPCRQEPVRIVWLCVRPQLYIYADGHAEPAGSGDGGLNVGFINRGAPESDAAWAARCRGKGGVYDGD